MAKLQSTVHSGAPAHIKTVALRLFAERGVDGVTVREIAEAAGQKNHAALTYHFGSKEGLIRELIVDGARAIDARRNAALDAAADSGGPHSVLEVMEILVESSISPEPPEGGEAYNRFVVGLQLSNRALFMDALANQWNSGYQRCLDQVRLLKKDIPQGQLNQRLVFMGSALGGILAGRETELADQSRLHPMWSHPDTLHQVAAALAAIIES